MALSGSIGPSFSSSYCLFIKKNYSHSIDTCLSTIKSLVEAFCSIPKAIIWFGHSGQSPFCTGPSRELLISISFGIEVFFLFVITTTSPLTPPTICISVPLSGFLSHPKTHFQGFFVLSHEMPPCRTVGTNLKLTTKRNYPMLIESTLTLIMLVLASFTFSFIYLNWFSNLKLLISIRCQLYYYNFIRRLTKAVSW